MGVTNVYFVGTMFLRAPYKILIDMYIPYNYTVVLTNLISISFRNISLMDIDHSRFLLKNKLPSQVS